MEVFVRETEDEEYYEWQQMEIMIDGKKVFDVCSADSPEDNNLHRNFSDCYSIPQLLKRAWEAGKNGEPFELTYEEAEDED